MEENILDLEEVDANLPGNKDTNFDDKKSEKSSPKKHNKNFIIEAVLFVLIFCVISLGIIYIMLSNDAILTIDKPKELQTLEDGLNSGVDIVYFGDSSVFTPDRSDVDKRSIPQILSEKLGDEYTLVEVSHPGYQPAIYKAFSEYVCSSENKPKIVIMPINLRVFSPEWYYYPERQFKEEIHYIENNENNTFEELTFKLSVLLKNNTENREKALLEWLEMPVYYWDQEYGKVKNLNQHIYTNSPPEQFRNKYIYHYGYKLTEDHEWLQSLNELSYNYEHCGIKLITYVTPINYEEGITYLNDFDKLLDYNVNQVIVNSDIAKKSVFMDLSRDLPADLMSITTVANPIEHLKHDGKVYVADRLAEVISQIEL